MTTPETTTPETTAKTPAARVRARPPVMSVTDAAADRIRAIMASRPGVYGLRISVKKGGCAGMEYAMSWAETADRGDEVVETKDIRILIDPMAIMYLLGTEMDYRKDKLSAQFVFNNPNQKSACGCGESVNLAPVPKERIDELKG